jgi:hypothetical protein
VHKRWELAHGRGDDSWALAGVARSDQVNSRYAQECARACVPGGAWVVEMDVVDVLDLLMSVVLACCWRWVSVFWHGRCFCSHNRAICVQTDKRVQTPEKATRSVTDQ